jgi:hypothetical protein
MLYISGEHVGLWKGLLTGKGVGGGSSVDEGSPGGSAASRQPSGKVRYPPRPAQPDLSARLTGRARACTQGPTRIVRGQTKRPLATAVRNHALPTPRVLAGGDADVRAAADHGYDRLDHDHDAERHGRAGAG